jgi:hypothetical protein
MRWTSSQMEGIHGNHTFRLQFAERDVNGPLTGAWGVEAMVGQVGRFSDAHTSVAKQQKYVGSQIIAAEQLSLE